MTIGNTSTIVSLIVMSVVTHILSNHEEKLEKFNGTKFKRWLQKMLFYLTTLNLTKFLYEDAPNLKENEFNMQIVAAMNA